MEFQSVVDSICASVKESVLCCLCHSLENIATVPIKKKTKDLSGGDIVIPWFIKFEGDAAIKVLQTAQKIVHGQSLPVKNISQDKHNLLSFHLDRPVVIQRVLKEVHEKGSQYGHCDVDQQRQTVSLRPFMDNYDEKNMMESPLHMRMFYVLIHLKKILQACGYQARHFENANTSECSSKKTDCFITSAKTLLEQQGESGKNDDGILNLRPLLSSEGFCIGKDGLDENLKNVEVISPDGRVTDIVKECIAFDGELDVVEDNSIIHVVNQRKIFSLQQMIVLHAALARKKVTQSQLIVGPVICKGDMTMEQFHRSRYDQMKEASEMRYGVKCEGPEWEAKIRQLSQAGIKTEVLGTALHCPLKMDVLSNHSAENRIGAFIMYNTARLFTLLKQFSEEVNKGTYPHLPPVEEVNFSLLREQEDWELLYVYVASFPSTVRESVEIVFPPHGRLVAKIHTHRITNFLISFSKTLSSYYSRYHILGGREAHLLPLMYARLHLVQACLQVMTNALHLLDIQPLEQL